MMSDSCKNIAFVFFRKSDKISWVVLIFLLFLPLFELVYSLFESVFRCLILLCTLFYPLKRIQRVQWFFRYWNIHRCIRYYFPFVLFCSGMWFHRKQFIFTGRLFIFYKNLHTSIMFFSFYIDEVVLFSDKSLNFVTSNQLGQFYVYLSQIDVILTIKNIYNTAVMCQVWGEIILQKFRVSILWGVNNKSVSRSGILVSVMMLMQPYKLLMSRLWILSKCSDTISFILRKIEEPDNEIHFFGFGCLCIPRNRSESEFKNRWSVKLRIRKFDQLLVKWWFGLLLDYLTYFCDRNWVLCFE